MSVFDISDAPLSWDAIKKLAQADAPSRTVNTPQIVELAKAVVELKERLEKIEQKK